MSSQEHWERVYTSKALDEVSWYCPHLSRSLELIERASVPLTGAIIDVGGGESTLVDDLLARGYEDISVPDISQTATEQLHRTPFGTIQQFLYCYCRLE